MWQDIIEHFTDSPSQKIVVKFLLENGFSVNTAGKICCNDVEIPATQIAKILFVDRRVVDTTAKRILSIPNISAIFLKMRATPDLSGIAETLGLKTITIIPNDANEKGIINSTMRIIGDFDLNIRQIFVTDPNLSEDPKLVIIVDYELPVGLVEKLKKLPQVKTIIL